MYLDVKIGKRGEVVIPAFVRKRFKLKPGGRVKLDVKDDSVTFVAVKQDAVNWFRETARKYGMSHREIIYGDKLYEEGF